MGNTQKYVGSRTIEIDNKLEVKGKKWWELKQWGDYQAKKNVGNIKVTDLAKIKSKLSFGKNVGCPWIRQVEL